MKEKFKLNILILMLMVLFVFGIYFSVQISKKTFISNDQSEVVSLRDVNKSLEEDGYSIYFRLNEGQLALVHPAQDVNCGKACGK